MNYANIIDGFVDQVIVSESDPGAPWVESAGAGVGWAYAKGVFTPPAPVTVRKLTKLEYMNRFTDSELAAIYGAAKVSPAVEVWLKKFEMATPDADGKAIDLGDPRTIAGLQALEAATLLGAGRATEILA